VLDATTLPGESHTFFACETVPMSSIVTCEELFEDE
jgi:hypothetical protein